MSAIRNKAPKNDLEHERDFWAWKYERREAECEELADRLRECEAERDLALAHDTQPYGRTKQGTVFHCRDLPSMSEESRAALECIVDRTASLTPEELERYEKARRSIVDARNALPEEER